MLVDLIAPGLIAVICAVVIIRVGRERKRRVTGYIEPPIYFEYQRFADGQCEALSLQQLGTFRPSQSITRAEFMMIVNRILGRIPETSEDLLTDEMTAWSDNADPNTWYYLVVQEATNSHKPEYKDETIPGLRFKYEFWINMMPNFDWVQLERR